MTYIKNHFKSKYIRSTHCFECGKKFAEGDECYTRLSRGKAKTRGHPINKQHPMKRLIGHICKKCYDRKFIIA